MGRGVVFTEIDEELDYLKPSNPLLPPDADAARALEVVPVHEDVDRQVKSYRDPGDGRLPAKLGIAEQDRGAVVVAVEECCWGNGLGRDGWI